MKKTLLTLAIAFAGYCSYAQTNTFPTSGNAGIGTTSPTNISGFTSLTLNNGTTGSLVDLQVANATIGRLTAISSGLYIQNITNGPIIFSANGADRVKIDVNGNVGIGTTSLPSGGKLQVNGPVDNLAVNGSGAFRIYDGTTFAGGVGSDAWANNGSNTDFAIFTPNNLNINAGGQKRITILSSGNVGIGTTTPSALLHVAGTTQTNLISFAEGTNSLGYLGRGGAITGGLSASPNVLALTYVDRDFAIAGWAKSDNSWKGISFYINSDNGNVGIGTTTPDTKLAVNGTIHSTEVKVDLSVPGPDYVFKTDYKLTNLNELKTYLEKNHHLPEIPSADQMAKEGINLSDMNVKLLKKVEELTLYLIKKEEQVSDQSKQLADQNKEISDQYNQLKEQNKKIELQQKVNQSLQEQINELAKKLNK